MITSRFLPYDLKLALLRCFADAHDHQHRTNVLGRQDHPGALEEGLKLTFTNDERALAHTAMRELEIDGLIQATHRDTMAPLDWLEITETGRRAVALDTLDELDHELQGLDPALRDIRRGAWSAVYSSQPDRLRQAAHSGRELIRQVLARLAPDDEVRRAPWFTGDRVYRSHRVRLAMERLHGRVSDSTFRVIEAQCEVVEANYDRLSAVAHADRPEHREHVLTCCGRPKRR